MSLAQKLITLSNRLTSRYRKAAFRHYPAADFSPKHIAHLGAVISREQLLHLMPKNGVVAELGVNQGDFSQKILEITQPEKLILVDVWMTRRYHDGLFTFVKNRFEKEILAGQIEIIRKFSFEAIEGFPDQYLDWVYIDTDHSYNTTKKELELLRPKMKEGAIIAGHDYIIGNWNDGVRYGVVEAVREFCIQYDWQLLYLTHELSDHPSFAIRKI